MPDPRFPLSPEAQATFWEDPDRAARLGDDPIRALLYAAASRSGSPAAIPLGQALGIPPDPPASWTDRLQALAAFAGNALPGRGGLWIPESRRREQFRAIPRTAQRRALKEALPVDYTQTPLEILYHDVRPIVETQPQSYQRHVMELGARTPREVLPLGEISFRTHPSFSDIEISLLEMRPEVRMNAREFHAAQDQFRVFLRAMGVGDVTSGPTSLSRHRLYRDMGASDWRYRELSQDPLWRQPRIR